MNNFRKPLKIDEIGIKAYSLEILKDQGLFDEKLYISADKLSKKELVHNLQKAGFQDGEKMFVRFSSPDTSIKLPKKGCNGFDTLYRFVNEQTKKDLVLIVHSFILGKYGGTITRVGDELVMEFIKGGWNADYSINVDTVTFKDGLSKWYVYQGHRTVPYVVNGQVIQKRIGPLERKTIQKIFSSVSPQIGKITKLLDNEFNSLEFLIDSNYCLKPIELQNIATVDHQLKINKCPDKVFELKTPHDLKRWDRTTDLLISIPADMDRADELLLVIKEIKNFVSHVYINYGILSHPAILLREEGIKVERKMSNYRLMTLPY